MSVTMDIFCDDCKEVYWYGQRDNATPDERMYSPKLMLRFLAKHRNHKLHTEVDNETSVDSDDYTAFEDKDK